METLPYKISEYIRSQFGEDILLTVNVGKDKKGGNRYDIIIDENGSSHHLKFNSAGNLLSRDVDDSLDEDPHDLDEDRRNMGSGYPARP